MSGPLDPELRATLGRGGLARLAYRLGHRAVGGVWTLAAPGSRPEVFVLRRGGVVCSDAGQDNARERLARLAAAPVLAARFDATVAACPPGALHQLALAGWARDHLEAQLDRALAERLVHELAGGPLSLRADLAPTPRDETDLRILAALARPCRLHQLGAEVRAPRFRLLAFLHFARAVGALEPASGSAAAVEPAREPAGEPARRATFTAPGDAADLAAPFGPAGDAGSRADAHARRVLGVDPAAAPAAVKHAYRRLVRALHPDLRPGVDDLHRRALERRLVEVTAAYEALQALARRA